MNVQTTQRRLLDPPGVVIEAGPVSCRRCGRPFAHLVAEEIKGIVQLRIAGLLVMELYAHCLVCGWKFHWNVREKDVEKMAVIYGEVLAFARNGYVPE